jgi:hypothetical protein
VLLRLLGLGLKQLVCSTEAARKRLEVLRGVFEWNYRTFPIRLVENGEEPRLQKQTVNRLCER